MLRWLVDSPRNPGWPAELGPVRVAAGVVTIRPIRIRDAAEWSRLRIKNQNDLLPWEPTGRGTWASRHQPSSWGPMFSVLKAEAKRGAVLPFVIEVDGRKSDNTQALGVRDASLSHSGCETIRIPAAQVRSGSGSAMEQLRQALVASRTWPVDEETFRSSWRRAGQIHMVLSHAINLGLVDPLAATRVVVSTDAVQSGDLSPVGFRAILADFEELAQRVGRLYGVKLLAGGLSAPEGGAKAKKAAQVIHISFYGGQGDGLNIHVSDASIPTRGEEDHQVLPGVGQIDPAAESAA